MVVHIVLPDALAAAAAGVLTAAGIEHAVHPDGAAMAAAEAAAADERAIALIGPYRSAEVAEAVEATAPRGLALLAPVATWAGVTRDDEPGCDDAADHRGTVLRLVARDTVVAQRLAEHLRGLRQRALVIAGDHDYGMQLDGQLRLAGLERAATAEDADVLVLAGLAGHPEAEEAARLAPLPVIAFDGAQGADLGEGRDLRFAMPFGPEDDLEGVAAARRAAQLVAEAVASGQGVLEALRAAGPFDEHGDPVDPPVWLWRDGRPDRPI
ncbi:MAG: hypothetical protein ACJ762_13960 [Solirubrobacteraceae bacterium]